MFDLAISQIRAALYNESPEFHGTVMGGNGFTANKKVIRSRIASLEAVTKWNFTCKSSKPKINLHSVT